MKLFLKILLSISICSVFAAAPEEPLPSWKNRVRARTLHDMDLLLHWGISKRQRPYPVANPPDEELLTASLPEIEAFNKKYGYFSLSRPIISNVSSNPADLDFVCSLIQELPAQKLTGALLQISSAEILTKALAYRDLKLNQRLQLPVEVEGSLHLETYVVDHIFDIWKGMPAFGLIPEKESRSSLLLFRGTDFSLVSRRGIASLMSDLDPAGPGLRAFFHARKEINQWLHSVQTQGKPARVMGFSLGGALAAYTFIYENEALSEEPSLSFCAPGVALNVAKDWEHLPTNKKELFISYINTGDLVPQVGTLFGTVYCLSTNQLLSPLTAHTTLICTKAPLRKTRIDTTRPPLKNH